MFSVNQLFKLQILFRSFVHFLWVYLSLFQISMYSEGSRREWHECVSHCRLHESINGNCTVYSTVFCYGSPRAIHSSGIRINSNPSLWLNKIKENLILDTSILNVVFSLKVIFTLDASIIKVYIKVIFNIKDCNY